MGVLLEFDVCQRRMDLVFLTQDNLRRIELLVRLQSRPLDADGGIVPHDAALVVGMVGVVDLVAEHRRVRQDQETMSKSTRDEELAFAAERTTPSHLP